MRELAGKGLRFVCVGLLATAVHVGIFLGATLVWGISPTIATAIAFLVALTTSYALNHSWTFRVSGGHRRYFTRYAVIAVTGSVLNMTIMYLCTRVLGWSSTVGLVVVVLTIPPLSFLGNLFWGFARDDQRADPQVDSERRS
jgi:putative flippase GtrA